MRLRGDLLTDCSAAARFPQDAPCGALPLPEALTPLGLLVMKVHDSGVGLLPLAVCWRRRPKGRWSWVGSL